MTPQEVVIARNAATKQSRVGGSGWCGREDFELPRSFPHSDLNAARLPIPPRPHDRAGVISKSGSTISSRMDFQMGTGAGRDRVANQRTRRSITRQLSRRWNVGSPRSAPVTRPELVWLLEHPPLYTAGTSARDEDLLDPQRLPVHRTGRGGRYTYHGPGQRIAYVMLDLRRRGQDVRCHVHQLEEWIIRTLARFDVHGERRAGRVGIWVAGADGDEEKIAAIGVRVRSVGDVSRRRAQHRSRPRPLPRDRSLRHRRTQA